MPKIVISYRRADSEAMTGRIHDYLANHYGEGAVYRDLESIPPGKDFRSHFRDAIHGADLFIAIIGPNWCGSKRRASTRIKSPTDPVRAELQTAMGRDIPVIPVLVDGAAMPRPEDLPKDIKNFSYHNAAVVDAGQDFRLHMQRLVQQIDEILGSTATVLEPKSWRLLTRRWQRPARLVPVAIGVLAVFLGALWMLNAPLDQKTGHVSEQWPPPNRSYWNMDGATVYLEATGNKRQFYVVDPSQDMRARGVLPGTLLFEGIIQRSGDTSGGNLGEIYKGTVFEYFDACGAAKYAVEGPVLPGPKIEVTGKAPRLDSATCKPIDDNEKTLVFDFKEKK